MAIFFPSRNKFLKWTLFFNLAWRTGWTKGETREYWKNFWLQKHPALLLHTPNVQCRAHPAGVILEAPQEHCSSPLPWFSTVNKHDVVLAVIAPTGMFLFYFSFHTYAQFHMFARGVERGRTCGNAWFISDPRCIHYVGRGQTNSFGFSTTFSTVKCHNIAP